MQRLEESLGKRMSVKEVAAYLELDKETVRRLHEDLGGIRLGNRILFFENLIVESLRRKCNAIQTQEKEQNRMDSRGNAPREEILQGLRDQERGSGLGIRNKIKASGGTRDPFGLLDPA